MITEPRERERWIRKNKTYYDDILRLADFLVPKDSTVLEIGCGTGILIGRLNRPKRCGIDLSPENIAYCRQTHPGVEFNVANALELPELQKALPQPDFDYVLMSDTLSYAKDVQMMLENASRCLTPDGRLVITAYNNLLEPFFRIASFLRLRSPMTPLNWLDGADLKNLFELSGLEVVSQGTRLLIPKWIPLISSWVNRIFGRLRPFNLLSVYAYYVLRRSPTPRPDVVVSVVVPARNEAGTIDLLVRSIPPFASHVELILVEGHSKDNTWEVIQGVPTHPFPWMTVQKMQQDGVGKADAVHKGFSSATGDILMILDADLSVQTDELPRFYRALIDGRGDFINGSRLVYRLEDDAMQFLNMIGNKLFGRIFSALLGQTFKDTLCGTKVLWRRDWKRIMDQRDYFGDFDPFGDFELLFGASKLNLKIISLPVHYKARIYGETNIHRFRHALILFRMCWIAARRLKFW